MHEWWPHILTFPRIFDPISWWWLSTNGYAFTSSGLQLSVPGAALLWWRKHNCHAPWCPFLGHHPAADGLHHLCARHHPDIPKRRWFRRRKLSEIHAAHERARNVD